jgi:hypothetical protein
MSAYTIRAIKDVAVERERQIEVEGWSAEHDDEHDDGALHSAGKIQPAEEAWPWSFSWWKPSLGPRRNLVRAGALIVAEIERLDRLASADTHPKDGDVEQAPLVSGAVGAAETPNTCSEGNTDASNT